MKRLLCAYGMIEILDFMVVKVYGEEDTDTKNLYPMIAEVRNAERNGYKCSDVLLLVAEDPGTLTDSDFERIRIWLMNNVSEWDRLFDEEIHVKTAGLPGKYEDNYFHEKTLAEYEIAPEIGLFTFPIDAPKEKNVYGCGVVEPNPDNSKIKDAMKNWELKP